jgi:hypothetical protein
LVAACPAPAAGIFGTTLTNLRMSLPWFLRRRPWAKPVYPPTSERFRRWITNTQPEDVAREVYSDLVCESGRASCEMLLAAVKLSKATVVDFAAVTTPVLATWGSWGECQWPAANSAGGQATDGSGADVVTTLSQAGANWVV